MDGGMNEGQEKECGLCGERDRQDGTHRGRCRYVFPGRRVITRWDTNTNICLRVCTHISDHTVTQPGEKLWCFRRKEVTDFFFSVSPFSYC